jgi:hypothetical protein
MPLTVWIAQKNIQLYQTMNYAIAFVGPAVAVIKLDRHARNRWGSKGLSRVEIVWSCNLKTIQT